MYREIMYALKKKNMECAEWMDKQIDKSTVDF